MTSPSSVQPHVMLPDHLCMLPFTSSQRIEVCGGIASGKTTLVQLLGRLGLSAVYEDFRANPFWSEFYKNPALTAFETEITFFLQHYHSIKLAQLNQLNFATDFSLCLDMAYARVTLDERKKIIFSLVHAEAIQEVGKPALLVHLGCDVNTQLSRIQRRAREEEKGISLDYLSEINAMLDVVISEREGDFRILKVNSSEIDFSQSTAGMHLALELISDALAHA